MHGHDVLRVFFGAYWCITSRENVRTCAHQRGTNSTASSSSFHSEAIAEYSLLVWGVANMTWHHFRVQKLNVCHHTTISPAPESYIWRLDSWPDECFTPWSGFDQPAPSLEAFPSQGSSGLSCCILPSGDLHSSRATDHREVWGRGPPVEADAP